MTNDGPTPEILNDIIRQQDVLLTMAFLFMQRLSHDRDARYLLSFVPERLMAAFMRWLIEQED